MTSNTTDQDYGSQNCESKDGVKCCSYKCQGPAYQNTSFKKLGKDDNFIDDLCDACIAYHTPECAFCKSLSADGDICMFCSKPYCDKCQEKWDG